MSDNHIDRTRHRLDAVGTLAKPRQIARADEDLTGLPVLTADQRTADRESEDRKRYRVGPETCEQASTKLMDKILATIDDEDTRDELELECGGNGGVLLQMFDTSLKKLITDGESNYGNAVADDIAGLHNVDQLVLSHPNPLARR